MRPDICEDGWVTDALPDFTSLPDLALRARGAVFGATDKTSAEKHNGWETARRREPGHDHPPEVFNEAIEVDGYPRDLA